MFCPSCKTMMFPASGKLVCRKCGHEEPGKSEIVKARLTPAEEKKQREKSLFIEDPEKFNMQLYPIDDQVYCGKCGNQGAYYYLRQTRKADEPTTAFYTCTNAKCGNKWRRAH